LRLHRNHALIRAMTRTPHLDLADFLPYRLNAAAARVSRAFARRYRDDFGLSIPEWRVLAHLHAASGTPVSVRDIEAHAEMEKSTVSRAAARLAQAGLVARAAQDADRRLIALTLTDRGCDLMTRLIPVALAFQAELLAELGPAAPGLSAALDALEGRASGG
jgi:DNA-binding MarR family transcriptional regulator